MADISKIKINEGEALNIKDAQGRTNMTTLLGGHSLTALGNAAWKNVATTVSAASTNDDLATAKAVYDAITAIGKALHFVGVATKQEGETELQAVERTFPVAEQMEGAIAVCGTKEFIAYGTPLAWNEFGDEGLYLTKAEAEANYVKKILTIAGIDLANDITADELKTALGLGNMAYVDQASGSISTVDSASVTAGKAGEYNVTAQTVAVPATFSPLDVTPSGDVAVTKKTGASVSYDKVSAVTVAGATAGEGQTANYTPSGTVSAPNVNASLDLKEASVATVTDAGTGYTISDGSVEQAADTTSTFAKTGMLAALDEEDTEMLCFTNAQTDSAVTASGAITYTKQEISGALPTFGSKDVVIKTGSDVSASLASAPVFTGAGAILSAEASFAPTDAAVTDAVYEAGFTGEEASVTPTIASTTDASVSQGKVTVASDTFDVNLTKTPKTVTVNPITA